MKVVYLAVLLAFFIAIPSNTHHTRVIFYGTLFCTNNKRVWCYHASLHELDNTRITHDWVDFDGARCQKLSFALFRLNGTVNGDGPWNEEYEFGLRIRHNCSKANNLVREIEYAFNETFPVESKEIVLSSVEYLLDNGIPASNNNVHE